MVTSIRTGPVRVLVPASSANLGPGFDSMGLALAMYDELIAMATEDEGVLVEIAGEGADDLPRDETHLVVRAMNAAFDAMGHRPTGFVLRCRNAIPHGRGLGSSASAVIGGMALARAMVDGAEFDDDALLQAATSFESHPDNLAAALHGGFTVAWLDEAGVPGAVRLDPDPTVHAIVAVPVDQLATTKAREALPETIDYASATHNVARSGLLVHALTTEPSLLWEATSDRLHQQARAGVYPESVALVEALRSEGLPAAISGAGPAVLVLTDDAQAEARVQGIAGANGQWSCREFPVSHVGAIERPIEV